MKGIIIAGGFGTRLYPLTYSRPKHLLPVANRPFLEYQVSLLRKAGVDEIVFATNYLADMIENHFGDGSNFGVKMTFALESQPLGTAGAIKNAAALLPDSTVIVLNGDILTDFDINIISSFHVQKKALATIALRPIERPHAFGALKLDENNRVLSWYEPTEAEKKAAAANPSPKTGEFDFINAGIYILEPDVISNIAENRPVSIEREVYPKLIAETDKVYGFSPDGFWLDIGNPDQYLAANRAVVGREVSTDVPYSQFGDGTKQYTANAGGGSTDTTARNMANAAFLQANNVNTYAISAYAQANATAGGLTTANSAITVIQGVDLTQNTQITVIQGVDAGQNAFMQAAFDKANSSIQPTGDQTITGSITLNGSLNVVNGGEYYLSGNKLTSVISSSSKCDNKSFFISSKLVNEYH